MPNLRERLAALCSVTDRLNPVLVKEARQAMRGRSFTGGFTMTQVFAVLITVILVVSGATADSGLPLLGYLTLSLAAVLFLYLPIVSFQSMAGEWDERAIDHLALSRLRPVSVLLGKLQWSAAQGLLFALGYLPFLGLTFLMHGVDVGVVLWLFASVFVQSVTLCAVALGLGAFAERRGVRPVCLIVLVLASVHALVTAGVSLFLVVDGAMGVNLGMLATTFVVFVIGQGIVAGFAIAAGVARLGHERENRSTPLRVFTSVSLAVHIGLLAWVAAVTARMTGVGPTPLVSGAPVPLLAAMSFGIRNVLAIPSTRTLLFLLAVPSALFVTERKSLSVRSARGVSRNPVLAMLAAPWLPGGQRGVLFVVLHFGVAMIACMLVDRHTLGGLYWSTAGRIYVIVGFLVLAASLATLPPEGSLLWKRLRVGIVAFTVLGMLSLPAVGGGSRHWDSLRLYALVTLTLPLLAMHVERGLMEVARHSRRNREAALTPL